jgi:hypothetical protein
MTVAATTNRKTYTGDNVTTSFATSPVIFYLSSNLQVRTTIIATGVSTLLTENTHYTVSGGGAAGLVGTINLAGGSAPHGALLSTEKLVILRVLPLTQAVDLVNNNASDAEVIETALDKLTDVDQQLSERQDRALTFPEGDVSGSTTVLQDASVRAGRLLGFDAVGVLTTLAVTVGTSLVDLASSIGSTLIGFLQAGAGAILRTLQAKLRDEVSVKDFGATGDGVTDDAAAIRLAIASGAKEILWPNGTYLCATSLVNATTYPSGIKMRALSSSGKRDIPPSGGVIIKYTGTGICWNIQEANGVVQVGGWEWDGFTFYATQGAAGMFGFNDMTFVPTGDATTPNFLCQIRFKGCNFIGAGAGATQTGNAIQCNKTFELTTDDNCYFAYWKRGVWLNTGDNCTIRGRFAYNQRHIMTTRRSIFGNSNVVNARYIGVLSGSAESRYALHLSDDTIVIAPTFELDTATDTCVFMDSYNISIYDPIFSMPSSVGRFVELGANCADARMFNPHYTGPTGPVFWNTIAAPASWDFGAGAGQLQHYALTVYEPSGNVMGVLTKHPRIRVSSYYTKAISYPRVDFQTIPMAAAEMRIARRVANAFNYWGLTSGSDMGTAPSIAADAGAPFGYAIQLSAVNLAGFYCYFGTIGQGIENGDVVNVRIYYKMSGVPAAGTFIVQVGKNNGGIGAAANLVVSAVYAVQNLSYTLAGFAAGDAVSFGVYNNAVVDKTLNIADISMTITQAAVVDTSGATLPNVEIEVNKLKAAMRVAGIISF